MKAFEKQQSPKTSFVPVEEKKEEEAKGQVVEQASAMNPA